MRRILDKLVPRLDKGSSCCGDRTRAGRRWITPGVALTAVGIVVLILWLSSCAGGRPLPLVTDADQAFAAERWPQLPVGSLEGGRQLYLSKCTSCHRPVDPAKISPAAWPAKIAEMNKEKLLDETSLRLIEAYVISVSSRPPVDAPTGKR
jgi:mono/diheme cytochrome c family protein